MNTVGQELIHALSAQGVEVIFGIPGVHTMELYRGLADVSIRHITPRHEQGAAFMADGYARVSGRPGVAFVITGPGFTNTLTAMGQARADSIPIMVISSENKLGELRQGKGLLHELPDQHGMASLIALESFQIQSAEDLTPAIAQAFSILGSKRPGPVHIEVPLDVAAEVFDGAPPQSQTFQDASLDDRLIDEAVDLLRAAVKPVVIAGGGAKTASQQIKTLAEALDAPVVQTVNARGVLHHHPLSVPASPSLQAVKDLIEDADVVLALGTEFGQTDYDMYATNTMAKMKTLIRVDICEKQHACFPSQLPIKDDARSVLDRINASMQALATLGATSREAKNNGASRAQKTRELAFAEIGSEMQILSHVLDEIREACPSSIMVGDSAQPIYAGNLYYDHDRPTGWFNAATGFGALGYAIPAAIGASVADPEAHVICIIGDGGAQFSLPELMVAKDENLNITFLIWNNFGYQEIKTSMEAVGVTPVGCDPTPPLFEAVATSVDMPYQHITQGVSSLGDALKKAALHKGPSMIEVKQFLSSSD